MVKKSEIENGRERMKISKISRESLIVSEKIRKMTVLWSEWTIVKGENVRENEKVVRSKWKWESQWMEFVSEWLL